MIAIWECLCSSSVILLYCWVKFIFLFFLNPRPTRPALASFYIPHVKTRFVIRFITVAFRLKGCIKTSYPSVIDFTGRKMFASMFYHLHPCFGFASYIIIFSRNWCFCFLFGNHEYNQWPSSWHKARLIVPYGVKTPVLPLHYLQMKIYLWESAWSPDSVQDLH